MSRRRRFRWILLILLLLVLAILVFALWPARSTYTISEQTTFVTGPLDEDGYVHYVAAVNEHLSAGISSNDNANALIWMALGPHPENAKMPKEYFMRLGYEPPEDGEYFITSSKYLEELAPNEDGQKRDEAANHFRDLASRPWAAGAESRLMGWLARNEKPLAVVIAAATRPEYYNPLVPGGNENGRGMLIGSLLPNVQKCREVAQALCCRAMLATAEGEHESAWRDLLACRRLGRLLARGGTLIEALVGIAIEQMADKAIVAFLAQEKLDARAILSYLRILQNESRLPPLNEKLDFSERCKCLDALAFMARGFTELRDLSGVPQPKAKNSGVIDKLFARSVNWDSAMKIINVAFDRAVAGLKLADRQARAQAQADLDRDVKLNQPTGAAMIASLAAGPTSRGTMIGYILVDLFLPAFDKVQGAFDRCSQIDRNLQLAFALAAYRAENGKYPAKFEDVAPKYIADIPSDIFSGKPPIYRLEGKGYLLYSVGPNGVDDGGHGWDDQPQGDDIVIRVPVQAKQPSK